MMMEALELVLLQPVQRECRAAGPRRPSGPRS